MTSRIEKGLVTFNCDGPACHKNYQYEGQFRDGWREAQDAGWVNAIESDDTWSHYCPKCKHIVGD